MNAQTSAKANINETIPFFGVVKMEESLQFYKEALGFEITHSWTPEGKIRWCHLKRGGASLMLQEYLPQFLPGGKFGQGVSICFICEDALELYHEFTSKGVDMKEPFVGNGMWVIELTDPDGYRLCFESYTNVPEETTYAEWKARIDK